MNFKRTLLFTYILTSCFCLNLEAQNQETIKKLAVLANKYNTFSKRYVQERVYLHMDNSAYFLGDTLWFKAYVTSSSFHRLSLDSWILYTELVSPEGQIIEAKKLPIINGSCHGHFDIDTSYLSGFYEVRSYTRAMLSFGDNDVFSRVVPVFRKPKKAGNYNQLLSDYRHYRDSDKSRKKEETISLSFYPEGGHLLKGVQNVVAIKAVDIDGKEILVKGDILDRSNVKIGSFTTSHRGMCKFTFIPNSKKYKARVMLGDKKHEFDLPDIEESGVVATIDSYSSDDSVSLKLLKSGDITLGEFGIGVSCRGQLYYLDVVNGETQLPLEIKISKAKLSSGVHEFVLFDTLGSPLVERKFFVSLANGKYVNEQPHTKMVSIDASNIKNKYKPLEKIGLNFIVKDEKGEPVKTSFSLSIRDPYGNIDTYGSDNVLTHLLLSSEVKGFIPDAGYYFESDDQARKKELDLLLMVQAWSKYPWKRMAEVEPLNKKQYVEKGFIISGSVYKGGRQKPMEDVLMKAILRSPKHSYTGECVTDEEGRFNFMFEDIFNNWRASMFLDSQKIRDESIIILDNNKPPKFKNYSFYEKDVPMIDIIDLITIDSVANMHVLEEIDVTSRRRRITRDYSPIVEDILTNANELIDLFYELDVDTRVELNAEHVLSYILYKHNLREGTVKYVFTNPNDSISSSITVADLLTRYALFKTFVIHRDSETRNNNEMAYSDTLTPIDEELWEYPIETHHDIRIKHRNRRLDGFNDFGDFGVLLDVDNNIESGFDGSFDGNSANDNRESFKGNNFKGSHFVHFESRIPDYVVQFLGHSAAENIGETFQYHRFMNFMGYSESKEFYSVDYSKNTLPSSDDYRRTLYWNPNVKTDDSGKAKIEFYNNSRCKDLNIDAQTITLKGEVGVYEKKGMR